MFVLGGFCAYNYALRISFEEENKKLKTKLKSQKEKIQ